jgi:hypothetical protein
LRTALHPPPGDGLIQAGYTRLHAGVAHSPLIPDPVFVNSRKDLEGQLPRLKPLLAPKGLLWVTYHKGTSKQKSDINRDSIAAYAGTIGLQAVAMIAVDEDWSALRLKVV